MICGEEIGRNKIVKIVKISRMKNLKLKEYIKGSKIMCFFVNSFSKSQIP